MKSATIKSIWRFPVKSFRGEHLEKAMLEGPGMLGDRAYALIDKESGKVITAKSVKQFPDILDCSAIFIEEPSSGKELPPVKITLPHGNSVMSDSDEVDQVLSDYFNKNVTLARKAPTDYTIDQYHPDIEKIHPAGFRDTSIEQKLGTALFEEIGMDSPIPVGSFMDMFPLSLITTSTLDHLAKLSPGSNFDISRFRMNLLLDSSESGLVENGWLRKSFTVGKEVKIMVAMPDPRCVMTTLEQNGIPKDTSILKTLVQHNRLDVGGGEFPCAGVYAIITNPGLVKLGDAIAEL